MTRHVLAAGVAITLAVPVLAHACSLCTPLWGKRTWRQETASAKLVIYGALANPRLPGTPADSAGATDVHIEQVVKSHPFITGKKVVTIPRWLPVDSKAPPKYLIFCDIFRDALDPYHGSPIKSPAAIDYLRGAIALEPADRVKQLAYFAGYLDHADAEVVADAFLEFAKADDADVAQVAKSLDPVRLRKLVTDPQTPADRLSLLAYLLGACGGPADADLLAGLLRQPDERVRSAYSGVLAGYVLLRPTEGWKFAYALLGDSKRPYPERGAVVSTLRFFHATRPDARREVLHGMALILPQGDMADMAFEDLRKWQWWDLTTEALAQFPKKSHSSPLVRRSIVRYALACPKPEAKEFVVAVRRSDPELVKDVEESLEFEKPPVPGK